MPDAFDNVVIQVNVGHFQSVRQGARVNGKAVVLRGYQNALGVNVADRLIAPVVSELEFHGFSTAGDRQDLVP